MLPLQVPRQSGTMIPMKNGLRNVFAKQTLSAMKNRRYLTLRMLMTMPLVLWTTLYTTFHTSLPISPLMTDMSFICSLRSVTLDDGVGLKGEDLVRLQDPPIFPCRIGNSCEELAISLFLALQRCNTHLKRRMTIFAVLFKSATLTQVSRIYRSEKTVPHTAHHNEQCLNSARSRPGVYVSRISFPVFSNLQSLEFQNGLWAP